MLCLDLDNSRQEPEAITATSVFCHLVVLVRLSVPVQVIDWRLASEMTYNVLMGTLNPTN